MFYPRQLFFVIIYTLVVMALFCVPSYFALSSTLSEEKYKATQEILEWIDTKEAVIFSEKGFNAPKSVRFKTAVYDENHALLYSDLSKKLEALYFKVNVIYPYLYYQKEVKVDGDKLFYLVVELKINYTKIFFIATMLFFVVLFLVFLMSMLFVNTSVYPYKKKQQYMNDFFNDAMHELKTPLGVIHINLELMARYVSETKHIQRMKSATKQMQMTYEDVEYYIKHKKVFYQKEVINFSEYLLMRIQFFEDVALPKSIKLAYTIEPEMMVYINKVELQRILDNTLSNAIKYSFFGGNVYITLERQDENRCLLTIKDEGQGIKDIHKVLRRFEREDGIQGGFGLGLNIVQKICNKNDVDLEVRSQENKGSTFLYYFQLDKKKWLDRVDEGKA